MLAYCQLCGLSKAQREVLKRGFPSAILHVLRGYEMDASRQVFVPAPVAKSRATVAHMWPGGAIIAKVDGGHIVFGSLAQYRRWKAQK